MDSWVTHVTFMEHNNKKNIQRDPIKMHPFCLGLISETN